MKIQNVNNNNYINFKGNFSAIKKEEINKENKYDVIEIKGKNINDDGTFNLQSIKSKLVSEINEDTNVDKINRIRDSINNNTYRIDVEEIVRRLLK